MSKLKPKAHFQVHVNYIASQGILHGTAQCDLIRYDRIRTTITERLAYKRAHHQPRGTCLVANWIYICCFGDLGAGQHLTLHLHGMEMERHSVNKLVILSTPGLLVKTFNERVHGNKKIFLGHFCTRLKYLVNTEYWIQRHHIQDWLLGRGS